MPLLPLPAARAWAMLHLLAIGLYATQLLLLGHWVMAAGLGLLALATKFALRQMTPAGPGAPRRLMLAADGRLHVACIGGALDRAELGGESLWLGSAVLLVLRTPGGSHRVLLGRGNVDPAALAALRRRLRGAAPLPSTPAVESRVSPRHAASAIEQFTRGNT